MMLECSRRKRPRAACASRAVGVCARALPAPAATNGSFSTPSRSPTTGPRPVQLLTRHWIITDGTGQVDEVHGPGVVGKQPTLGPGESFEYTSGCPLSTPFGIMEGTYQMVTESGETFDATIAPFTLSEPYTVH